MQNCHIKADKQCLLTWSDFKVSFKDFCPHLPSIIHIHTRAALSVALIHITYFLTTCKVSNSSKYVPSQYVISDSISVVRILHCCNKWVIESPLLFDLFNNIDSFKNKTAILSFAGRHDFLCNCFHWQRRQNRLSDNVVSKTLLYTFTFIV